MKPLPALIQTATKHKKTIIQSHNALHMVYWVTATVAAPSIPSAVLYGGLAVLTGLVSFCAQCHLNDGEPK